jgi:hypothetical protein
VAFQKVKIVEAQEEDRGGFEISVQLPNNTTLAEAEEYFLAGEKTIEDLAAELDLDGWFLFHRATFGEFQGWFKNPRTNEMTPREATRRVMEALPEKAGVRLFTGDEDATDDEIGAHHGVLDVDRVRVERLDRTAEDVLEVRHRRGRHVENGDLGAHADRDRRRVPADHAAAEDDDPTAPGTGHAAEQDTLAAVLLLEAVRADLNGHASRHLAHRTEEGERAIVELDRLVGDAGDLRLHELLRELGLGREVKVRGAAVPWPDTCR